jgi:hypothetical protein
MTKIQVGIPWRPTGDRVAAMVETVKWYEDRGFEVHLADSADRRFNLPATRNQLVRQSLTSEVMVLSDADTTPELDTLLEAIEAARSDNLVHLPYHLYRSLSDGGAFVANASSGIYVFTRAAWDSTNGQDARFEGWGYEDTAWMLAHLTLNGPVPRHHGTATAAAHLPAPRDKISDNLRLFAQYQAAYGVPERMWSVVNHEAEMEATREAARNGGVRNRPLGARA